MEESDKIELERKRRRATWTGIGLVLFIALIVAFNVYKTVNIQ